MTTAKVTWTEKMQFVGHGESNHAIVLDAADDVGGQGTGARPYELFLVGLAGCSAMDTISILQKKRQNVLHFEVSVNAERADEHPKVYTKIHLKYRLEGHGINQEAVRRAVELSQAKYCAAYATLSKAIEISHSFEIVESIPSPA